MSNEHRLSGDQIRVGEPVPYDCYDGHGQLLLKRGLIVHSQKQVDFLLERGLYADVNAGAGAADKPKEERPPTPFQLLNEYSNRLKNLFIFAFDEHPTDTGSFSERVLRLSADIQRLCRLNADALLGAIHLDFTGRYTVAHPLYRSIVCELVAARKGMPEEERIKLIAASLTCDLSIIKLQEELFRQEGPMRPEQKQVVTGHPVDTVKLLKNLGVADDAWLTVVLQHHELLNGKGYPFGLTKESVSFSSRVVTLADIYTAMITPRAYRKALLSRTAMRDIFLKRGSEIDEELAVIIVKELGVYPPGAFVRLQNGEVAIVIKRSTDSKAPAVKAVVGPRGAPFDRPISRSTAVPEYVVNDVVERDTIVKINLHQLWDYDPA